MTRSRTSLRCGRDVLPKLFTILVSIPVFSFAQGADIKLWYTQPAPVWTQALPIGNGRIGAMVFGGANSTQNNGDQQGEKPSRDILDGKHTRAQDEHLQLNEDTVWQGARTDKLNPKAHDGFLKVRSLLLESKGLDGAKISQAERLAAETMLSTPRGMPGYSSLGDLYVRSGTEGDATDYRRELDLSTGIASVTYTLGGVHYQREAFASAPDHVMVLHLAADKPGRLIFAATMDRPSDFDVHTLSDRDLVLTQGPEHKEQIKFQGQVRILVKGGKLSRSEKALNVSGADEATLLIAAASDFRGDDPAQQCAATLETASRRSYNELRAAAGGDEQRLMDRVSFQLGESDATLKSLPTDERLRRVSAGGTDLGLQALYFQYGRYLLTGSSRPGGLPANLQGLWAGGMNNPWGSKWTININ
ncbi:MAG TPA: glycoside hydrolase family 95 protein, partial [Bryobacteraceae bacterium]